MLYKIEITWNINIDSKTSKILISGDTIIIIIIIIIIIYLKNKWLELARVGQVSTTCACKKTNNNLILL
jgi:hypothetical protein